MCFRPQCFFSQRKHTTCIFVPSTAQADYVRFAVSAFVVCAQNIRCFFCPKYCFSQSKAYYVRSCKYCSACDVRFALSAVVVCEQSERCAFRLFARLRIIHSLRAQRDSIFTHHFPLPKKEEANSAILNFNGRNKSLDQKENRNRLNSSLIRRLRAQ